MDPVSALTLVANVYAVVEIGFKLVSIGIELDSAIDGQTEDSWSAHYLAHSILEIEADIKNSSDKWEKEHTGLELTQDQKLLQDIADHSSEIARNLIEELKRIRVQKNSRREWIRATVVTFWKGPTIEEYRSQLKEYRDTLNSKYIVGLRQHFQEVNKNLDERFNRLDNRTKELAEDLLSGSNTSNTILKEVNARLQRTHVLVETLLEERSKTWQSSDTEALHKAAKEADIGALQVLLRNSQANINAPDEKCRTALHYCTSAVVATKLINLSAKINEQDFEGSTPLHMAVKGKHLEVVQVLLSRGADSLMKDYSGNAPLVYSVDIPAVTFMLRNGAQVEARDKTFLHNTGLFHMAWLGDIQGVKFYLGQNADVDSRNARDETCLAEAARHGDLEIVKLLLASGADIEALQMDGYRPLLRAIKAARPKAAFLGRWINVGILLEHRVNLSARDKEGCTALHRAIQAEKYELAQRLLASGASPNIQCDMGKTPLFEAASKGQSHLVERLLKARANPSIFTKSGDTPLAIASALGHIGVVEMMLNQEVDASCPVDANKPGAFSWTPLAQAASNGHSDIVDLLLKRGANANFCDYEGLTALHRAVSVVAAKADIVSNLLAHEAKVDSRDKDGMTPLATACRYCSNLSVLQILSEHGADIESPSNGPDELAREKNFTPLMHAVSEGRGVPATIGLLVSYGANLDAQTSFGRTALLIALQGGRLKMADALIEAGANVNIANNYGSTPLHIAARNGFVEQAKNLIAKGASLTHRDHHGKTAEITAKLFAPNPEVMASVLKPLRQ